ncbi:MAG: hypothetical protein A3F68_10700 [Acidobacteria bacterium RIFCSPLOWO2_12_FULL_54_10]|nr:MAG: hypothetical protein A3F68_10700 [Acidobacteria bacterium RIFCSPLOWO2_12_FULL_54_10]
MNRFIKQIAVINAFYAGMILFCILFLPATPFAKDPDDAGLVITHQARGVQPGEVVLLQVQSDQPISKIEGTAFGKKVFFYADGVSTSWKGLVGIDLGAQPKKYPVLLTATSIGNKKTQSRYELTVQAKDFPTRRITVQEQYVNPPAEELERIQREDKKVATIFSEISKEKLWSGGFLRPVPGEATSSFGVRSVLNGQARSPHSGTDFRGAEGTPVAAPNAGKIVLAENLYFSGNVVIIDHGWSMFSYFAHLSKISVQEGQEVSVGDLIGSIGMTGRVTGPHLHWSLRLAGARVDPLSLLEILP